MIKKTKNKHFLNLLLALDPSWPSPLCFPFPQRSSPCVHVPTTSLIQGGRGGEGWAARWRWKWDAVVASGDGLVSAVVEAPKGRLWFGVLGGFIARGLEEVGGMAEDRRWVAVTRAAPKPRRNS
jgi:hypothetical protein